MTTPGLPTPGQLDWGTQLNEYIEDELDPVGTAAAAITVHDAATDPHGDRSYANQLVSGFTTGANGPNGFLQLDGTGHIPASLAPTGGGIGSLYDVKASFGAKGDNATDDSTVLNTALSEVATAGGGWVWFPAGTYCIASPLVIGSNTALMLTPGATIKRIGNPNAPGNMLVSYTSSSTTGASNILIMGGQWVADGVSTNAIPMSFVNATNVVIRDTTIRGVQGSAGNPAVFLAGCNGVTITNIGFTGAVPSQGRSAYTYPAIQIENTTSTSIAGLNSAMYVGSPACTGINVDMVNLAGVTSSDGSGAFTFYSGIAGSLFGVSSTYHQSITVTGCNGNGVTGTPVAMYNWKYATVVGNNIQSTAATSFAVATWLPSGAPTGASQVVSGNAGGNAAIGLTSYKAGNTSRTSSTLLADPDLSISGMAVNGVYEVRASIIYACESAIPDFAFDFALPSGASMNYSVIDLNSDNETSLNNLAFGAGSTNFAGNAGDTAYGMTILGLLAMGSGSGTFSFKWSPSVNVSFHNPMLVDASSYMILTRIA